MSLFDGIIEEKNLVINPDKNSTNLALREPKYDDFDFLYNLKCEKTSIYWGGFEKAPNRNDFFEHYKKIIEKEYENRQFFILEKYSNPVGYLQLTKNTEYEYEIGYGVSEEYSGKGYGTSILAFAQNIIVQLDRTINLIGYVRKDNIASNACFEKNKFKKYDKYIERYFALDGMNKKMYLYVWNKEMGR